MRKSIEHLKESLELSIKMLDLAERGVGGCQDDGCLVVYGVMRDCAYTIRRSAERELEAHFNANTAGTKEAAASDQVTLGREDAGTQRSRSQVRRDSDRHTQAGGGR